jgi:hypothetical protein
MAHREAAKAWAVAARRATSDVARLEARGWQAMALGSSGRAAAAARVTHQARTDFPQLHQTPTFARILNAEAVLADQRFEHALTRELANQAIQLTEGLETENRADALHLAMLADSRLDDRLGDKLFTGCVKLCRQLDLQNREFTLWISRAQRMERRLRPGDQVAAIEEAKRLAVDSRHPVWLY